MQHTKKMHHIFNDICGLNHTNKSFIFSFSTKFRTVKEYFSFPYKVHSKHFRSTMNTVT